MTMRERSLIGLVGAMFFLLAVGQNLRKLTDPGSVHD